MATLQRGKHSSDGNTVRGKHCSDGNTAEREILQRWQHCREGNTAEIATLHEVNTAAMATLPEGNTASMAILCEGNTAAEETQQRWQHYKKSSRGEGNKYVVTLLAAIQVQCCHVHDAIYSAQE